MSTEPDAALVEAWLAGRDAAAAVCNDRAHEWDNIFSDAARFGLVEALQCREAIRALQPPALATLPDPRDAEIARLRAALETAVATIRDYLAYEHDGDPWSEDARIMGEMDINDYATDGRLARALMLIERARAALAPQEPGHE